MSPETNGNYMNDQQLGQQFNFSPSKIAHSPTKPSPLRQCQRIVSIPGLDNADDLCLHDRESANYLQELRNNRVARLNGSRPPPPSRLTSKRQQRPTSSDESLPSTTSTSARGRSVEPTARTDFTGRPLVTQPTAPRPAKQSPLAPEPLDSQPGSVYIETGQRWREEQEAQSLHAALDDLDLEDEQRIHTAAQDEAAELVWMHRTGKSVEKAPTAAYRNPDTDPNAPKKDYRAHARTGSCENSNAPVQSVISPTGSSSPVSPAKASGPLPNDPFTDAPPSPVARSVQSKGKSYEQLANAVATDVAISKRRVSSGSKRKSSADSKSGFMSPTDKIFEEPDEQLKGIRVTEAEKTVEKVEKKSEELPRHVRRNPFARVRLAQEKFEKKETPSGYSVRKNDEKESPSGYTASRFNNIEIQKNPPTQSRNAFYTVNDSAPTSPKEAPPSITVDEQESNDVPIIDGKEIRGDDIRAATSMRRKDRSPNLPQPTAVSDSPGRPIVSFHSNWKPQEIELVEERTPALPECLAVGKNGPSDAALSGKQRRYSLPRSQQGTPPIPSIVFPDDPPIRAAEYSGSAPTIAEMDVGIPTIVLPEDPASGPSRVLSEEPNVPSIVLPADITRPPIPTINAPSSDEQPPPPLRHRPQSEPSPPTLKSTSPRRPLPTPSSSRPLPVASKTSPFPAVSKPHMTPSVRRTTALCAHCALPIAGRILSAAGERFHPACFKCHQCGINLECVAFYPEPDKKRAERLARIQQRQQGLEVQIPAGVTEEDIRRLEEADGDESLRFFCGLDFHESFSPRCKSCKTPIEGEVVVACGAEWHVGHFFCAQCGDPFDSSTPFVEKEGYAWCVGCHTNRYSAKCRKCRRPVTEIVVKALGAEWHAECFCCTECGDGFDDGRYFLRGNNRDPVCVRCEDRRLKA